MSILQGVKAVNMKPQKAKFIIKPKLSTKQNKEQFQIQTLTSTDNDVFQFIQYMIAKSTRLRELIQKKSIFNQQQYYQKAFFKSICLKTMLKQILQKMLNDRRLGKNLKGMNKSNLVQIQGFVWNVIERETNLYLNEMQYTRLKKNLLQEINQRKQDLLNQINEIEENKNILCQQNIENQLINNQYNQHEYQ